MTFADLTQQSCQWLSGTGPMHDVVISSRVRLARNLAGMPFLSRCSDEQRHEIEQRLREQAGTHQLSFFQSNAEAELIDQIHAAGR